MIEFINRIKNDEILNKIKPFISGKKVYLVGGFVRDILMNLESPDRDLIVCECDVKEFSQNLAKNLNAHFIELDKTNNIYRIVLEDKINYLDITSPVENDFEKDIKRRDLTINAIAYDIANDNFIDLTGGIEDIKNKRIRGISDKNFIDDPLRLLRIFRFFAKTGFEIDKNLEEFAKKHFKEINKSAKERITVELLKMFEGEYCDLALEKLDECRLLCEIFPIFEEVKKVPKNAHHHLDLLHHSIETVKQIQLLYEKSENEVKNYLKVKRFASVETLSFLKLAAFLHDIGKPSTWTIDEETQRHRFIKHDEAGAQLCVPILRDLKFSKKQIEYIKTLIKYHIYPASLVTLPDVTDKAIMKFYRKMDNFVIDVILLAQADRLSARGEAITQEMIDQNINGLNKLLNDYINKKEEIKPLPKLLDGKDIMEILKLSQGPKLGNIIKKLQEAQLIGEVNTKEEAINFIKSIKS